MGKEVSDRAAGPAYKSLDTPMEGAYAYATYPTLCWMREPLTMIRSTGLHSYYRSSPKRDQFLLSIAVIF